MTASAGQTCYFCKQPLKDSDDKVMVSMTARGEGSRTVTVSRPAHRACAEQTR
jgi:hypothetical protein